MSFLTFTPNYFGYLASLNQEQAGVDNIYVYVADGVSTNQTANSAPKTIDDELQIINQMLYGRRIHPNDITILCRRINWVSGKYFAKYDSSDPNLVDKDFYCLTSARRVYKCLSNNNEGPSTVEPTSIDQMPTTYADGYVWKYLYSLSIAELTDYSTSELMPIIEDANTVSSAVRGTISDVDVIDGGNYLAIHSGNILQVVSNTVFRVEDTASNIDDIYNGSAFYITAGPGEGSLRTISDYYSNAVGRYVVLSTPLVDATISSEYEITPSVQILGDGTNAAARAIMTPGGLVDRVDMLNYGQNYTYATSTLVSNASFTVDGSLKTIISPHRGHGYDIHNELYANYLMYHIELDSIDVPVPVNDIKFSRVGLVTGLVEEANTAQLYTGNNFVNTATIEISPLFGVFATGDLITKVNGEPPYMKVVYANTSHIVGVYQHNDRYVVNDNIVNQNGVTSLVISITQPDIKLIDANILSVVNVDTITRNENSRETLQIVIKIK